MSSQVRCQSVAGTTQCTRVLNHPGPCAVGQVMLSDFQHVEDVKTEAALAAAVVEAACVWADGAAQSRGTEEADAVWNACAALQAFREGRAK